MARITVEDCLQNVDNRFNLVMVASKRARQISVQGQPPMVEEDSDKATVIALREIADGLVTQNLLNQAETEYGDQEEQVALENFAEISPGEAS